MPVPIDLGLSHVPSHAKSDFVAPILTPFTKTKQTIWTGSLIKLKLNYEPYITQIREIAQQCGVNFPGPRGGRDSDEDSEDDDDDDTIPELPDEIDTDVRELRGGPFNYGN